MKISNKIELVMGAKNVSVDELSEKTGLTRMTVYNAKNGNNVTISTALKITEALGVKLEEVWSTNYMQTSPDETIGESTDNDPIEKEKYLADIPA